MKHSQLIGIIAVLALIGICFVPWSFIPSKNIVITGFQSAGTDFGRPGYLNIILSTVCLLFFAIPKIWAKRANVFIAAIKSSNQISCAEAVAFERLEVCILKMICFNQKR